MGCLEGSVMGYLFATSFTSLCSLCPVIVQPIGSLTKLLYMSKIGVFASCKPIHNVLPVLLLSLILILWLRAVFLFTCWLEGYSPSVYSPIYSR